MAVQMRTMLAVADNSGARKLQVILPLGGGLGVKAGLGDVVTAAVKEASPDGTVKKGKVVKAPTQTNTAAARAAREMCFILLPRFSERPGRSATGSTGPSRHRRGTI